MHKCCVRKSAWRSKHFYLLLRLGSRLDMCTRDNFIYIIPSHKYIVQCTYAMYLGNLVIYFKYCTWITLFIIDMLNKYFAPNYVRSYSWPKYAQCERFKKAFLSENLLLYEFTVTKMFATLLSAIMGLKLNYRSECCLLLFWL